MIILNLLLSLLIKNKTCYSKLGERRRNMLLFMEISLAFVKKHFFNLIFVCLFGTMLFKQTPMLINSYKKKGTDFPIVEVISLKREKTELPLSNQKAVYIFWATWCSPCHLQLKLFKKAVDDQKISASNVVAVWSELGVVATPSIAYVDKYGKIKSFSAGFSPLAVYKAANFLEQKLQ